MVAGARGNAPPLSLVFKNDDYTIYYIPMGFVCSCMIIFQAGESNNWGHFCGQLKTPGSNFSLSLIVVCKFN